MIVEHKIMSFQDIIYDLSMVSDFGKFKNVSFSEDNPAYSKNFWILYKNKESDLWKSFPDGSVWKKPNANEWRFYFNLNGRKITINNKITPVKLESMLEYDKKNKESFESLVKDIEQKNGDDEYGVFLNGLKDIKL